MDSLRLKRWRAKGEKQVARLPALKARVTGSDEDHPVDNRGSSGADRTAARRNAVHRLGLLRSVVLPDDMTVAGGERAQHSVQPGHKYDARNDADGGSESSVRVHGFGWIEAYRPAFHSVREPDGRDRAGAHCEVGALFIGGASEDDLPARDVGLPHKRALLIRIMGPNHAGFLAGEHQALTVREVRQDYAGGEIPVGVVLRVGAVVGVGDRRTPSASSGEAAASRTRSAAGRPRREAGRRRTLRTAGVPHVARLVLLNPENFARLDVERHYGIGASGVGLGEGVARA